MAKQTPTRRTQGMNWIRPSKRLAIYLRDGLACGYCHATIEQGARLTLDHLVPYSKGGTNDATNLVTACGRCNSSRGNRTVQTFIVSVAAYLNRAGAAPAIAAHIKRCRARTLDVPAAALLMANRGGFVAACRS
jgi:hypothetical protein